MRDRTVGETIYLTFTTRAFATGVPTVLAGTPVVSAYEDDSVTQITAGITLGVDHDGVVGLNLLTIVATGGNGYEAGKEYNLVITTGTVGGVSVVGECVGAFSLSASASVGLLGTPVALDGGAATVGGMLTKLADDNGGADFDAELDSQEKISTSVSAIPTTAMRGTDNAALASVLGALNDAAAAGDVTDADTLMQYMKQILNEVSGSTGIGTMPAGANPANGTNLFEIVRGGLGATFDTATDSNEQLQADVAAIPTTAMRGTDNAALASLFTGITSLAEWLGLIAGKQVGNATARTELRATGAGSGTFDETADSQEAIRDRGDVAWITGGGGGITDILNLQPSIPTSIDLANTATVRLGLILTNALDDLPSTAEITPGTISIDRKAIGGTSWSSVVSDAAMSEQAGMVYFDEVFDTGAGYAEGDSIRVTFKSVKITVAANDYEICDANGIIFQTEIRQTMRGTDSALLAASAPTNFGVLGIEADGDLTKVNTLDGHTPQTGDSFARIGANGAGLTSLAQASVATEGRLAELDAANLPADVDAIGVSTAGLSGDAMRGTDSGALASVATEGRLAELDPANLPADVDAIGVSTAGLSGDAMRGTDSAATEAKQDIIDTNVDAIKAKTDDLTFTKANELDANNKSINDVTVNGTGTLGDEWGP